MAMQALNDITGELDALLPAILGRAFKRKL
jgi:hypothetical protein